MYTCIDHTTYKRDKPNYMDPWQKISAEAEIALINVNDEING